MPSNYMAATEMPFVGQSYYMHWNSPKGERYRVEFFKGPIPSAEIDKHRNRAWNLHQKALRYDPLRTMRELVHNMQAGRGGSIYFAATVAPEVQDVGYVTQRVMVVNLNQGDSIEEDDSTEEDDETIRALNVSTKVFLPDHQQKGLSAFFAEQANLMHRPDIFVGRTQNPYVILSLRRTGLFEKIYPIDSLYEESPRGSRVLEVMSRKTGNPAASLRKGLCVGAYPPGAERTFIIDEDNQEAVEIYRRMREIGMDPENGDAVLYTAVIRGGALSYPVLEVA